MTKDRHPGLFSWLAGALLVLTASGCALAGERTTETANRAISRPDGVLVVFAKEWFRSRFRLPMDHGASETMTAAVHQAFFYPADGSAPVAVPLNLSIDYEASSDLRPDLPVLTWKAGALTADICRETPDMMLDCGAIRGASIFQFQARIEDAYLDDNSLVLAVGPDGTADCRIDMSTLGASANSISQPERRELGNRWTLAHFPARASYLMDNYDPEKPLYRLYCGQTPVRIASLQPADDDGWTEILDIAPGAEPANPRILYSTRNRFEEVVLRDTNGDLWARKVGAIERGNVYFLDQSAETLVLDSDFLFRKTAGLSLQILNIATGEESTLSWDHDFDQWPERP